jgi:hypothetical protein
MSAGRIVLLIFGILILLLGGLGPLLTGVLLLLGQNALVDGQGYISSETLTFDRDSYAIVIGPTDSVLGSVDALRQLNAGTIRIEGENNDASKEIFIGIIEESDLEQYLGDVEYTEVTSIGNMVNSGQDVTYDNHSGDSPPTAPAGEALWTASVSGTGAQTLEWKPEEGAYWIVMMNNDGSANVNVHTEIAAKVGSILFQIGIVLVIVGVLLLIVGGLMIFFAFRGRKKSSKPQPEIYTMAH